MCIDCEVDSMQVDEKVYRPSVIEGTMLRAGREERHQYRFTMRAEPLLLRPTAVHRDAASGLNSAQRVFNCVARTENLGSGRYGLHRPGRLCRRLGCRRSVLARLPLHERRLIAAAQARAAILIARPGVARRLRRGLLRATTAAAAALLRAYFIRVFIA